MIIGIGCDPNAQKAKEELIEYINKKEYGKVIDYGSDDTVYANVAFKLGEDVSNGKCDKGILICGTGIGMSIAANKVKGVYAALVYDTYSAERAALSNDANIICMGAFTMGEKTRERMTDAFLSNKFIPGCPSQKKVDAYKEYDENR